jgi:hypothetical protein
MGTKGGSARHVYLNKEFEVVLDAIAEEVSNSRLGPHGVSRSQLINKAIENYIEECRNDSILKGAVEKAEGKLREVRKAEILIPLRMIEK